MSKIIKGGNTKFFPFTLGGGKEEEFNPLRALLPEEALLELERLKNTQEDSEAAIDNGEDFQESSVEGDEIISGEEVPPAEESSPEPSPSGSFDISGISLEELARHPEVSLKLSHLEQEAYEKGFAQGQKDGQEIGRRQYESLAKRLKALLTSLEKSLEEHILGLEPQLFALLKLMLEKLVLKEVSTSPEVIKNCLREALAHVVEQTQVKIHLHPDDVEFLEEILGELRDDFARIKDFEIVSDSNISRGGCLLETEFGLVDATLDRRLREILKRLDDESAKP